MCVTNQREAGSSACGSQFVTLLQLNCTSMIHIEAQMDFVSLPSPVQIYFAESISELGWKQPSDAETFSIEIDRSVRFVQGTGGTCEDTSTAAFVRWVSGPQFEHFIC